MTERQTRAPVVGKPWIWAAVVTASVAGLAWCSQRSSVSEQGDSFEDASAAEPVDSALTEPVDVPLRVYNSHLAHLRVLSDGTIVAVGSEGAAMRSVDDGQSFQLVETRTRELLVDSVAGARSGSLVVVGSRGIILRSDDGAKTFLRVPVDTERAFRAVSMLSEGNVMLAVGDEGVAYVSQDGGQSFAAEESGSPNYLARVVALPKRPRFVVGGDNGTFLLRDGASGWRTIATAAAGMITALSVMPDGTLLAGTQNGFVLNSRDDGETWQEAYKTNTGAFVVGFDLNPAASVLVARTRQRELLFSGNQGKSFELLPTELPQGVAALGWVEGSGFIGLGVGGARLSSDPTGKRWRSEPTPSLARPFSLAIHPVTQTVLVVGSSGLAARSTDQGKQYQLVRPGLGGILRSFADNSPAGCLVAVGLDATVVRSVDAGKNFRRVPVAIDAKVELTSVVVEPNTRALLASGTAGTLLRSSDCGEKWQAVAATKSDVAFLLTAEGSLVLALAAKSPVLRSTDAGVTFVPAAMDGDATLKRAVAVSATEIIAVGDSGRIYRSSDAGSSFQNVVSGTDANLRALAYDAVHRTSWAAGDGGVVLRSNDAGVTWHRVSVPTGENLFVIGLHPSGELLWLGGNQGTVLRSSDPRGHFNQVASGSTQTIRVIVFDPSVNEFVVAGTGGTLLRTIGQSRLTRVAGSFEGRIDAALFHAPSGALFLGGDRLIRMGQSAPD